jgi:CHAT domain-containing protein
MVGELLVRPLGPLFTTGNRRRRFGAATIAFRILNVLLLLTAVAGAVRWYRPEWLTGRESAAADIRLVECRLSDQPKWAPFRGDGRSPVGAVLGVTVAGAGAVRGTSLAPERGAARSLLEGNARQALETLKAASAKSPSDPRIWSDLSAAFQETAAQYDAPELLADALAAADRALALDARLPEARFNRALVLQRLGLREDARAAWMRYLDADASSGWANEARERLASLEPRRPFAAVLEEAYAAAAADPQVAGKLVDASPQEAREKTILEILDRWAQAVIRNDAAEGERHLAVARQLGMAISGRGGDQMVAGAVAAIDASNPAGRSLLAAAHAEYSAGLRAFRDQGPEAAEPLLRHAAQSFAAARSPVALAARYFAANAAFEQGRQDEAETELDALEAQTPSTLPVYRAFILWQLGTVRAARGDWGQAIPAYQSAAALFDRAGESQNAGAVRRLLAFVYDRVGDPSSAWSYRVASLRGVGQQSDVHLEKAVMSMADEAVVRRDWHTASSFLTLSVGIDRRLKDDVLLAHTLLARAVVRDRLRDGEGATSDLAEARAVAARPMAPSYRASIRGNELVATAMLSSTSPADAEAFLSEVIGSDPRRHALDMPVLRLHRARARRSLGNVTGAMADLEAGIAELERQRESLPAGESRWGAFHASEELFDEAIELALVRRDAVAAFGFAEQARARALLDAYGRSPRLDIRDLPPQTVVVEYVVLPSRVIIFTVSASGIRSQSVACDRDVLLSEVETLTRTLEQKDAAAPGSAAAAIHRRLIEPVAAELRGARTVVFIPDRVTSAVPFAALVDERGEYLIERHAVVVAPSAAVFAAAAERRAASPPATALIVSAPDATADAAALRFVEAETQSIARLYPNVIPVTARDDAFDLLSARAAQADVIHFAGHAVGDDSGIEPASIVLRQDGRERRVGPAEIAKLRLRRTAVVVLAGCGTSRGERRASEGVISVAHGFLTAGAPSVIATLWPIDDDDAAVFFPRLHARLAEGLAPAEALRSVQLDAIRRGDIPLSLWAAVQTIGS